MGQPMVVICCECGGGHVVGAGTVQAVCAGLEDAGVSYERVTDLCDLAARGDERLGALGQADKLYVLACEERAVRWLLHRAGVELGGDRLEVYNLKEAEPGAVVAALGGKCRCQNVECKTKVSEEVRSQESEVRSEESGAAAHRPENHGRDAHATAGEMAAAQEDTPKLRLAVPPSAEGDAPGTDWVAWFPVIDYERCSGCRSCLNFCLFGVYGVSEAGQVEVQRPDRCKTNCPACARVCPMGAIIFPKYPHAPINGGEEQENAQAGEAVRVDVRSVLGDDVHAALRRRGRGRGGGRRFAPAEGGRTEEGQAGQGADGAGAGRMDSTELSVAELGRLQRELGIPSAVIRAMCEEEIAAVLNRQRRLGQEQKGEGEGSRCKGKAARAAAQVDQEGEGNSQSQQHAADDAGRKGAGGCGCGG